MPIPSCFRLLIHWAASAFFRAEFSAGRRETGKDRNDCNNDKKFYKGKIFRVFHGWLLHCFFISLMDIISHFETIARGEGKIFPQKTANVFLGEKRGRLWEEWLGVSCSARPASRRWTATRTPCPLTREKCIRIFPLYRAAGSGFRSRCSGENGREGVVSRGFQNRGVPYSREEVSSEMVSSPFFRVTGIVRSREPFKFRA